LKDSLIVLAKDALASLRNLLPIVVVISVFQVFVFRESVFGLLSQPEQKLSHRQSKQRIATRKDCG
jgi:hypothetical protein